MATGPALLVLEDGALALGPDGLVVFDPETGEGAECCCGGGGGDGCQCWLAGSWANVPRSGACNGPFGVGGRCECGLEWLVGWTAREVHNSIGVNGEITNGQESVSSGATRWNVSQESGCSPVATANSASALTELRNTGGVYLRNEWVPGGLDGCGLAMYFQSIRAFDGDHYTVPHTGLFYDPEPGKPPSATCNYSWTRTYPNGERRTYTSTGEASCFAGSARTERAAAFPVDGGEIGSLDLVELTFAVTRIRDCDGRALFGCDQFLGSFVDGYPLADINGDGYIDGIDYDLAMAVMCGGATGGRGGGAWSEGGRLARRARFLAGSGVRVRARR